MFVRYVLRCGSDRVSYQFICRLLCNRPRGEQAAIHVCVLWSVIELRYGLYLSLLCVPLHCCLVADDDKQNVVGMVVTPQPTCIDCSKFNYLLHYLRLFGSCSRTLPKIERVQGDQRLMICWSLEGKYCHHLNIAINESES